MDDQHVGTIGLGDELNLTSAAWSLGYIGSVSAIRASGSPVGPSMPVFEWLNQRGVEAVVEVAVHPQRTGARHGPCLVHAMGRTPLDDFVGIDFGGRTIPHHLHLIQVGGGEASRTWLTVDTDDAHHRPWRQGHPTRSKDPDGRRTPRQPSEGWLKAIERFGDWVERSGHAARSSSFRTSWSSPMLGRLARPCSTWRAALTFAATAPATALGALAGGRGGADGSGQAVLGQREPSASRLVLGFALLATLRLGWPSALAQAGVTVDSSVNPSRLVRRKAGPTRRWSDVTMPWLAPGCWSDHGTSIEAGRSVAPALHLPGLAGRARRAWRNLLRC